VAGHDQQRGHVVIEGHSRRLAGDHAVRYVKRKATLSGGLSSSFPRIAAGAALVRGPHGTAQQTGLGHRFCKGVIAPA